MNSTARLKLLFIVFLAAIISVIVYHRYSEHRKYENISRFDYLPKDSIDYSYYDQQALHIYLDNCTRLTNMAKQTWLKYGVDVRTARTAYGEAQSSISQYHSLLTYTKILEARMLESKDMKDQDMDNDDIEMVLNDGITIGAVENEKDKMAAYEFLKGKNTSASSPAGEIWEVQKLLNANDYNLTINGIFDASTDSALLDFKKSNNIYPSHVCDDMTLKKLAE